ncbi:MAG: hypothetical protein K0R07_7 [Sedimentibacter sp.]|jgi:outer membrane lipoprotein SlyB|nr:hypothetical protein [Sedimentibacter sp.]
MELLGNEKEVLTIQINHERFKLTDKRLLYKNGSQEAFIGINEVRGANLTEQEGKQYTYNYSSSKVAIGTTVVACLIIFVYNVLANDDGGISGAIVGSIGGSFFGIFYGIAIGAIVGLIAYIIQELSANKVKLVHFTITQKDGNYWYDGLRSDSHRQALNKLKEHINSCIYQ